MDYFADSAINIDALRKKAFNLRWAEVEPGVIPLTAADPDFPAAPEIIEAIQEYIADGYLCYAPKEGMREFRESISSALNRRKGEDVPPELILPIDSAARGMYTIARAVLSPGDEVIIFDPVDFLFRESAVAAGGVPVLFPATIKDNRIDLSGLESYVTGRTKMIGLCNPHNPLGTLYSREDLALILDIAEKYGLYIMNDEIWSDIVYPGKEFLSILSLGKERNKKTASVYGFSKSFGVAGLRIGCVYCQDEALFRKIYESSDAGTTAGGISTLSQVAGIACMDKAFYRVDAFIKHLKENRDYALSRIEKMKGICCHRPDATYLLFADITGTGQTSSEVADFLRKEAKLAVVPGVEKFFGPGARGHIRICFATGRDILKEAMNRLEMGLDKFTKE